MPRNSTLAFCKSQFMFLGCLFVSVTFSPSVPVPKGESRVMGNITRGLFQLWVASLRGDSNCFELRYFLFLLYFVRDCSSGFLPF